MESSGGFEYVAKPLGGFVKNSVRLIKRCTKPDQKGEPAYKLSRQG